MKTILISGVGRGLGRALVQEYLDLGWRVVGISRSFENFKLTSRNENFIALECDVRNFDDLSSKLTQINFHIDVIVVNAAKYVKKSFFLMSEEEIDRIIDTNLKGAMYLIYLTANRLRVGGKIIFVNSVAGISPIPNETVYAASKSALRMFAEIIGAELKTRGIFVTSIFPGGINTEMQIDTPNRDKLLDLSQVIQIINNIVNSEFIIKEVTFFSEIECF